MSSASPRSGTLPFPIFVLALGAFALGTSEFMVAGILDPLAHSLGISIPVAGGLITAFAIGMLVSGPLVAALTIKLPRKPTLIVALVVFTVAHILTALTTFIPLIFALRVVSAVGAASFWAVGMLVAVQVVEPRFAGRAVATMIGGITVANVVGIPLGTFAAAYSGWQAPFWVVAVLGVIALIAVAAFIHAPNQPDTTPFFARLAPELRVFARPPLLVALGTSALFQAAVFAALSYVSPILIQLTGTPSSSVGFVMLGFGLSTVVGVTIGARVAHLGMLRNVFASLGGMLLAAVLMLVSVTWAPGFIASFLLFGMSGFSCAAALNGRVFGLAEDAATLASGVNVSAFNVGNALGPLMGGLAISAGAGLRAPLVLTIVLVLAAAGLNFVGALQQRRLLRPELRTSARSGSGLQSRRPSPDAQGELSS